MVEIVNNKNSDLIRQYGNFKTFKTILKQFGTFLNVTMFKKTKGVSICCFLCWKFTIVDESGKE